MKPTRLVRSLACAALAVGASVAVVTVEAHAARQASGKPSIKSGDPEAVWIWFDSAGWHLRGSVGKSKHSFVGYLRAQGGMAGVKPTRTGLMKKIEVESGGLRFEFELNGSPKGGVEGFDWQQSGEECVTVELKIDGKQQPARVFVGLRAESPELFPFLACKE